VSLDTAHHDEVWAEADHADVAHCLIVGNAINEGAQ